MKRKIILIVTLLLAGVGTWWALSKDSGEEPPAAEKRPPAVEKRSPTVEKRSPDRFSPENPTSSPSAGGSGLETASPLPADSSPDGPDEEPPQTEEEKAAAAGEAKVEAFDDLTDKWMEPSKTGVTMTDVDGFVSAFRQVPKDRQDECVHRALNLIPDENVMLLTGILMDKAMDKEIVETVFNDILNRDEAVKKPILQQILKDKSHPCWADAAWIQDVTGE